MVPGETIKAAFERASKVPFEIPEAGLSGNEGTVQILDTDFIGRLWLLGITFVLFMASGEQLVRLKVVKPKNPSDSLKEFWSPNFLGRVYQSGTEPGETGSHLRAHWKKGHLKSQPHGSNHLLRKVIWIHPYRTRDPDKS